MTLTRPTHHALLPEISRTTGDLTAGNAASGSLEALATFVGPVSSGVVLAVWGAGGVLLGTSACTAVGAALAAGVVTTAPRHAVRRGTGGPAGEPAGGPAGGPLRAVLRHPAARSMSVLVVAEYALVGMMDILLVVLALDVLGMSTSGPGFLNSAIGVGGVAGAALTFVLIGRPRLAGPLVAAAVCAGLAFALAGQSGAPAVALALVAVSGAGKLFYDVASRTFIQRLLPDHMLTAVFGLQESFTMVGTALGTLAAPVLVLLVEAQGAFVAAGCFLPLVALASYRNLRRLDHGAEVPADVLALLMQVPILAVLPPRIVERLARDATAEVVPAGETVVRQGEAGTRFYVIASGRVRVDIYGSQVRDLGPGEWFGEIALLRDVPRTASITAVTHTALWGVDRDAFVASVLPVSGSVALADRHIRDRYV